MYVPNRHEHADIDKSNERERDNYLKSKLMNIWKIGFRVGNALRKLDNSYVCNECIIIKKPRAYIRNAHWHTYWIGSKGSIERRRSLVWIQYTCVGFSWESEETDIVRILK